MELKCHFGITLWLYMKKTSYSCFVNSASITKPKTIITSINGAHLEGKTHNEVYGLEFHDTNVQYFPGGLHKIFPNLNFLSINNCGLKLICRDDLIGLEKLSKLRLDNNKIQSLPEDLFDGMKNLRAISFSNNEIKFISSKLINKKLKNQLIYLSFRDNRNINTVYDKDVKENYPPYTDIPQLVKMIEDQCQSPEKEEICEDKFSETVSKGLKDLWAYGTHSDFNITTNEQKFHVHRNILAVQSSFFAELFKKESHESELKVENLSTQAVEEVLRFIYTRKTPEEANMIDVFTLASKWRISDLKSFSEEKLMRKLDQSNALKVFELAHRFGSERLKNSAFEEIKIMLGEPDLPESLMNSDDKLRKLVESKRNYESMLKSLKQNVN